MSERCDICEKDIAPGEEVTRCRVSKVPGEWHQAVEHIACINARPGEMVFTCGPVFTIGETGDIEPMGPYTQCGACNGNGCDRCMPHLHGGDE